MSYNNSKGYSLDLSELLYIHRYSETNMRPPYSFRV